MPSLSPETWISIFMAFITTASAVVTYAVYRSSTDPVVVVFAYADTKRHTVINIKIKNIGKGPAYSISFNLSQKIPVYAWGVEEPDPRAEEMSKGPLICGIPFLAPDQELIISWGQYAGISSKINGIVLVESKFYRSKPRFYSTSITSHSNLDIAYLLHSESSEHGFGPNIVEQLKELNKNAAAIAQSIEHSQNST